MPLCPSSDYVCIINDKIFVIIGFTHNVGKIFTVLLSIKQFSKQRNHMRDVGTYSRSHYILQL